MTSVDAGGEQKRMWEVDIINVEDVEIKKEEKEEDSKKTRLVSASADQYRRTLPCDLILLHIVPRLISLPQIYQLRCVCKSWYASLPNIIFKTPTAASLYQRWHNGEPPWLVMVRFSFEHHGLTSVINYMKMHQYDHRLLRTDLVAYIPSLRRWFPFPLPSPFSSLLGAPNFQNTVPDYGGSDYYGNCYPLLNSAGGLLCTLVYSDDNNPLSKSMRDGFRILVYSDDYDPLTKSLRDYFRTLVYSDDNNLSEFNRAFQTPDGLHERRAHYFNCNTIHWPVLVIFNPLTGETRRVPLPSNNSCLLRRGCGPLSLSVVQVYDEDDQQSCNVIKNKCRNYVLIYPKLHLPVDSFMYLYDVQLGSWQGPICYDDEDECNEWSNKIIPCGSKSCDLSAHPITPLKYIPPVPPEDIDILQDADIVCFVPFSPRESVLFGYSIDKKVWMKAYMETPYYHTDDSHYTTWRGSASRRVFLASAFKPSPTGIIDPDEAAGKSPSTTTGFDVYELKRLSEQEWPCHPDLWQYHYYWHHLSRTPPEFRKHVYPWHHENGQAPARIQEFFITSGRLVCMTAVDYEDSEYLKGNASMYPKKFKRRFPFGSYSCPLVYDILLDKWFELPHPRPVLGRAHVHFPLFAFQPSFNDLNNNTTTTPTTPG